MGTDVRISPFDCRVGRRVGRLHHVDGAAAARVRPCDAWRWRACEDLRTAPPAARAGRTAVADAARDAGASTPARAAGTATAARSATIPRAASPGCTAAAGGTLYRTGTAVGRPLGDGASVIRF